MTCLIAHTEIHDIWPCFFNNTAELLAQNKRRTPSEQFQHSCTIPVLEACR
jgi:hypothetical protein